MMRMIKNSFVNVLIFIIIVALYSPIFHQHAKENHPQEPLGHTHNISLHSSSDYSLNSHGSSSSKAVLSDSFSHTHYHSHFGNDLLRIRRIENQQIQSSFLYMLKTFNNLSTQSLALKKYSYNQYKSKYYSRNSAKTSSGLSPPIFST